MKPLEIISLLNQHQVLVSATDDKLSVQAPQGKLTDELLALIKNNKAALLAFFAEQSQFNTQVDANVVIQSQPENESGLYPLSFAQQRLWFIDQLDNSSEQYNMPFAMQVTGKFDTKIAKQALEHLIERHEVLRSVYLSTPDGARQRVLNEVNFTLVEHDLSAFSADEQQQQVKQLRQADSSKSFDLSADLMVRASFIRLAETQGILLFNVHHIACDGWSIGILSREFIACYQALAAQNPIDLPALEIQYGDFCYWQRQQVSLNQYAEQLNYWQQQLADIPAVHGLKLDYARPASKQHLGGLVVGQMPADIAKGLNAFARQHQLTPFMLLHGMLARLLARHSDQQDIVIGTPVANRMHQQLAPLVGFFVNTLVLRLDTSIVDTKDYFAKVREVNLAAQANQDVPFDQLVEQLEVARSPAYSPLFQILLTIDNNESNHASTSQTAQGIDGLTFSGLTQSDETNRSAKFDLTLSAEFTEEQLQLSWIYDKAIFDKRTIEQLNLHLSNMLTALVQMDNTTPKDLASLEMLSQQEQDFLINELNDRPSTYPQDITLTRWFEQTAKQYPTRLALCCEDDELGYQELSYQDLDKAANQLAHHLIDLGVKPQTYVGLCVNRSIDMILATIAILKAGAIYVPLDPAYPQERLQYMLDDSGLSVMLSQQALIEDLPKSDILVVLDDPALKATLATHSCESPALVATQSVDDLAYVIYTSGSTGEPKGVMIEHNGVVNMTHAQHHIFAIELDSRVLHFASMSFDAAVSEWLMALLKGASLFIATEQDKQSPQALTEFLLKHRITTATIPPAFLALMDHNLDYDLKCLMVAGEACDPSLADLWRNKTRLLNGYGPSENSVCISMAELHHCEGINVGKPIENVQAYILDKHQQLLPFGATGELYVGGIGLARGYLNKPELTAKAFIDNPFTQQSRVGYPSNKLYRTGDMVRYLADGTIDFVGRADQQVSVRGFRVELGEIENHLSRCDLVNACVVLLNHDANGFARLVAYVEPQTGEQVSDSDFVEQLRGAIEQTLAAYMMPSLFMVVRNWPLTPNGKIDKKALPQPDASASQGQYVAPQGEIENQLVQVWTKVLSIPEDTLSVRANFFEIGGHSLLAVRLIGEIEAQLGFEFNLKTLFSAPYIRAMARLMAVEDAQADAEKNQVVAVKRDKNAYPLSFAQQRLWFIDQLERGGEQGRDQGKELGSNQYNMPLALKVTGAFDLQLAHKALNQIVARHEGLRCVYFNTEQGPMQQPLEQVEVAIEYHDLSALNESEQAKKQQQLLANHNQWVFDLTADIPLKVSFLLLGDKGASDEGLSEQQGILLFNIHHIAADGWSMQLVVNDFVSFYQRQVLAPLALQPIDYAIWQREYFTNAQYQSQLDYWQEALKDLPTVHSLPLARSRPAQQSYVGARVTGKLPASCAAELKSLAVTLQMTPFMLLHSALVLVLARHSYSEDSIKDIVIGTPVANRRQAELGSVVGCFINILVLRAKVPSKALLNHSISNNTDNGSDASIGDFLAHIKQINLDALDNQAVSFEHLVEQVDPERSSSHSPLFQIQLTLNEPLESSQQIDGVRFDLIVDDSPVAKFDIDLGVTVDEQGIYLNWVYNRDIFDQVQIERINRHLECLLTELLQVGTLHGPAYFAEHNITDLPLLSGDEKRLLVDELNKTDVDYPLPQTIDVWIAEQAKATPDKLALVFDETALSYEKAALSHEKTAYSYLELEQQSNQLANHLISLGVGPDVLVGLCFERSIEMVIAIVATLKAGGAYVPLEPQYPAERLTYMLNDTQVAIVLTEQQYAPKLEQLKSACSKLDKLICLDCEAFKQQIGKHSVHLTYPFARSAKDLAYVIYTSGSTGQPKGVMVEHRALMNRIYWMQQSYQLHGDDVVLQKTPFSFDVSVWEFLWPLCFGGKLVVAKPQGHTDPYYLAEQIERHQVSLLHFVPSMLQAYLDSVGADSQQPTFAPSVRAIFCSGEALEANQVNALKQQAPHVALHNLYGPTEAAIDVSFYPCSEHSGNMPVPIGKAIDNIRLLILDDNLELCPFGAVGQLYIGGVGLARGYLNKPQLSGERFIADPFAPPKTADCQVDTEARLYQTGDLARYLEDGNIAYLGRVDSQVKIRGLRIELGEIEQAIVDCQQLKDIPADIVIKNAVVKVNQQQQLVAYVQASTQAVDELPLIEYLQSKLKQRLPDYMVPAFYLFLPQLPLNANGKIDHKALIALSSEQTLNRDSAEYRPANNQNEQILVDIWASLLRLDGQKLSTMSNFFALGGDSIVSIQVVARAAAKGLHFSIKDIFDAPTISELAKRAKHHSQIIATQQAIVGEQVLLPIQRRFFQDSKGLDHYNQAVLLQVPADFSTKWLFKAVKALYQRHDVLRLRFDDSDAGRGFYDDSHLELLTEQSVVSVNWQNENITHLCEVEQRSLSITHGPVFKAVHFCSSSESASDGRLLLLAHHLVIDGVSWRIILDDLQSLYGNDLHNLHGNAEQALAAKTSAYQAWGAFLAEYSQSQQLKAELEFWQAQSIHHCDWPKAKAQHPSAKPSANSHAENNTGVVGFKLTAESSEQLLSLCNATYRSQINELLLTALVLAIAKSQQKDAISYTIALEGHGREALSDRLDLSQTVGWFTTLYPLTLHLTSKAPNAKYTANALAQAVLEVKRQYRKLPNNGIGYGVLKYLANDVELGEQKPQLLFNYLGQFNQVIDTNTDFKIAPESYGNTISAARAREFELMLNGMLTDDGLAFELSFEPDKYCADAMKQLMDNMAQVLEQMVHDCSQSQQYIGQTLTLDDVPLATVGEQKLTQAQLDNWQQRWPLVDVYPATGMQQGLLFHSMLDSGAYVVQMSALLDDLDVPRFKQAWQVLVAEHDILRTVFAGLDDSEQSAQMPLNVYQLVLAKLALAWQHHDFSHLSIDEQRNAIDELIADDGKQGFDLTNGPLMRLHLVTLNSQQTRFIWSFHHALLDGWCLTLAFVQLDKNYQRLATSALPVAGNQVYSNQTNSYRDYVAWLIEQDQDAAADYWQQQLAAVNGPTPLPLAGSSLGSELPDDGNSAVVEHNIAFSAEQTQVLKNLAAQTHTTLNIVVQGAWALLLARYQYQQDSTVVFGAVNAGRPAHLPGVEHMMGLFINTVPVVVEVNEQLTLKDWLKQLHLAQVERQTHSFLSLQQIQAASGLKHQLFNTLFTFENHPRTDSLLQNSKDQDSKKQALQLREVQSFEQTTYPISLIASGNEQLQIDLQFFANLMPVAAMAQLTRHLQQILMAFCGYQAGNSASRPIADIEFLTELERAQLVSGLNLNSGKNGRDDSDIQASDIQANNSQPSLIESFELQAKLNPQNVALEYSQQQLSYDQLNSKANQMAHYLASQGIKCGDLVGVCLAPNVDLMVSLLAIFKLGAYYLPLAVDLPQARLAYMIEDSQLQALIINEQSQLQLDMASGDYQIIAIDRLRAQLSGCKADNFSAYSPKPNDLAYMIYTSGSTGQPKGSLISQANLSHYLVYASSNYLTGDTCGAVVSSSISFDATITSLFAPLMIGKSVKLLEVQAGNTHSYSSNFDELLDALFTSSEPWLFKLTPAHLTALAGMSHDRQSLFAHQLVIGGDELTTNSLKQWSKLLPNARFINEYGPTETTVGCSTYVYQGNEQTFAVPIGRGIDNTRLYVLDSRGRLAPFMSEGELFITGSGVSKGYFKQAKVTAKRFAKDTFCDDSTGLMYQSGDLVRYMPDGNLIYQGRIDNQLKVRGYRIEPSEIAAVLESHAMVKEALVLTQSSQLESKHDLSQQDDNNVIVAHLLLAQSVNDEQKQNLLKQLKQQLAASLPHYMHPVGYQLLTQWPLNNNGKIDRAKLAPVTIKSQGEYLAPQSPSEVKLQQLWQSLLQLEQISTQDNFFDLGGHSLTAVKLINLVRDDFAIELPINSIFQYPTITALAQFIDDLAEVSDLYRQQSMDDNALEEEVQW